MRETGARQLLERELAEDPLDRAARRAHERWTTWRRVWAACDRAGITDEAERVRFIFDRLWPDLPKDSVERMATLVSARAAGGGPGLLRPTKPEQVVGERLAGLMKERGYT